MLSDSKWIFSFSICLHISPSTGLVQFQAPPSLPPKMLCTSMRLTDRRFRIETTVRSNQMNSNSTATITIGTTPFIRPCTMIKISNNDLNGKRVKSNASIQDQITEANTTNRIPTANGSPDTKNQPNNNNNR